MHAYFSTALQLDYTQIEIDQIAYSCCREIEYIGNLVHQISKQGYLAFWVMIK